MPITKPQQRPFFISVEGVDGSGKSTLVASLSILMAKLHLHKPYVTKEPGGTPLANRLREVMLDNFDEPIPPETEAFLSLASRRQHVEHFIIPAIEKNRCVISDRFIDSLFAYQVGGRKMKAAIVSYLIDITFRPCGLIYPHLTFLLDGRPEIFLNRKKNNKTNRLDKETIGFYKDVRTTYLELAETNPGRIHIINAELDQSEVLRVAELKIKEFLTKSKN